MNQNKLAIESLSMDLLRVSLGYHRGTVSMAKRFSDEAMKRLHEIDKTQLKPYFSKLLPQIEQFLTQTPTERTAEDALMYSVRCKNYASSESS